MSQKVRTNGRVMVKLHGPCNTPGEVIGVTLKCRGGLGKKSDEKHQTRGWRNNMSGGLKQRSQLYMADKSLV